MNIYRINEYDWYAADTFDEAVLMAMSDTDMSYEDIVDDYSDKQPAPLDMCVWNDETHQYMISVGKILSEIKKPGLAFSTEW